MCHPPRSVSSAPGAHGDHRPKRAPLMFSDAPLSIPCTVCWDTGFPSGGMAAGWHRLCSAGAELPVPRGHLPQPRGRRGRAPGPRRSGDGGAGRVAMEIFSLADALGRCKKRLCPPRCAAQCQQILHKQEAPRPHAASQGHHHHQRGETEARSVPQPAPCLARPRACCVRPKAGGGAG